VLFLLALLCGVGLVVVGLAVAGRTLLRRLGFDAGLATGSSVVVGLVATLAWVSYFGDLMSYAAGDEPSGLYEFSAYARYRDAQSTPWSLGIGFGYALLAAGLAFCTLVALDRLGRMAAGAGVACCCVAVALPGVIPTLLPQEFRHRDVAFYASPNAVFQTADDPRPTLCFTYGVEPLAGVRRPPSRDPELCLRLRRNVASCSLIGDFRYDVQLALEAALHDSGIRPYEVPTALEVGQLVVEHATWARPPGAPPRSSTPRGPIRSGCR
jgi:hypothetical protein